MEKRKKLKNQVQVQVQVQKRVSNEDVKITAANSVFICKNSLLQPFVSSLPFSFVAWWRRCMSTELSHVKNVVIHSLNKGDQ